MPTGWTVFETPSTPWLPDIRPIRILRLRLEKRRRSVFSRQALARGAEAREGARPWWSAISGEGKEVCWLGRQGAPANAATGGDALVEMPQSLGARRPWSPLPTADHAPRAQKDASMAVFFQRGLLLHRRRRCTACSCSCLAFVSPLRY